MKRLFAAALLSLAIGTAQASGGDINGFHECKATLSGVTQTVYVAVKAAPDGLALWAVLAPHKTSSSGYGIGSYNPEAGTLSGFADDGYAFNWQVNGTSISGMNTEKIGTQVVTYPLACTMIF